MRSIAIAILLIVTNRTRSAYAAGCRDILSCSNEAISENVDPCCVPTPEGLFVFRQRFEPEVGSDAGSWGMDGVDVLE